MAHFSNNTAKFKTMKNNEAKKSPKSISPLLNDRKVIIKEDSQGLYAKVQTETETLPVKHYIEKFDKASTPDETVYYYNDHIKDFVELGKDQLKKSNSDRDKAHYNKYQNMFNLTPEEGDDWCAAFVSWCARNANIPESVIPSNVGVRHFYDYYVNQGHGQYHTINSDYEPQPGDLMIWYNHENKDDRSHIGIVEKYENGKITTVEGNIETKRGDSTVGRVTYDRNNLGCNGFITPDYPPLHPE